MSDVVESVSTITTVQTVGDQVALENGYGVTVIETFTVPDTAVDISPPPPDVVEVGTVVFAPGAGGGSNVTIGEGPPASVAAGELYVELSGGVVNEFWTA